MNNHQTAHSNRSVVSRCGYYFALVGMLMLLSACPKTGEDIDAAEASNTTNANPSNKLIQLPVEVFGAEGAQNTVSFKLSAEDATNGKNLWLQTHNVRYPEKASVSINGGEWIALNNTTAEMLGSSKTYGGIGGSIATLQMTLPIASGVLKEGDNTLDFRFNVSNGLSNGYRVIGLNVLDATSNKLIAASNFTEVDPASFTAPSEQASDIAAGRDLWNNAPLQKSFLANAPSMIARCADCHTATGADLKYFGYSNKAIIERAKFHGLNDAQGQQIASYIRSLPVKAIGRPWNPPYQPGPSLAGKPNDEWAAGAGIASVAENSTEVIDSVFPNGINREALMVGDTTKFKRFPVQEVRTELQLPDWNHWLPEVHPYDSFGKAWADNHNGFKVYRNIRNQLTGKTKAQIRQWYAADTNINAGIDRVTGWFAFDTFSSYGLGVAYDGGQLLTSQGLTDPKDPQKAQAKYSAALWFLVKMHELQQEFDLTDMGDETIMYARKADKRVWVGSNRSAFNVSPFLLGMDGDITGNTSGGNNNFNHDYLSVSWYNMQMLTNAGQRSGQDHSIIDWGYSFGFQSSMNEKTNYSLIGNNMIWGLKGMDEGDRDNDVVNTPDGWSFRRATGFGPVPLTFAQGEAVYPTLTNPTVKEKAARNLATQVWLEKNASWLPYQYARDDRFQAGSLAQLALGDEDRLKDPTDPLTIAANAEAAQGLRNYGYIKRGEEDGGTFSLPGFVIDYPNQTNETRDRLPAVGNYWELKSGKVKPYRADKQALWNGKLAFFQAVWPGLVRQIPGDWTSPQIAQNDWLQFAFPRVGNAPAAPSVAPGTDASTVTISWANSGAPSYNVKRSDSPNGPFMTIAYYRTGTSYTEKVPMPNTGRTYYYRISTNANSGTESPDSASALIAR